MVRLRNRQLSIPNGIRFYWAPTGFKAQLGSFDNVVQQFAAHLRGNPHQARQSGLNPDDYEKLADVVDEFNALNCKRMMWYSYITGVEENSSPPFSAPPPNLSARLGNVAAGAETLVEWIAGGHEAVPAALAEQRAGTCAACPHNQKGDFMRFFTLPVTAAIQFALRQRTKMRLATTQDDHLGVCALCDCPLKLKIHMPLHKILARIKPETLSSLPEHCWIARRQ